VGFVTLEREAVKQRIRDPECDRSCGRGCSKGIAAGVTAVVPGYGEEGIRAKATRRMHMTSRELEKEQGKAGFRNPRDAKRNTWKS
jgi:hypothetical protein